MLADSIEVLRKRVPRIVGLRIVGDIAIVGDIDPAAFAISGAYTPVPGGVGALTIAMLMHNTVKAAKLRRGFPAESR